MPDRRVPDDGIPDEYRCEDCGCDLFSRDLGGGNTDWHCPWCNRVCFRLGVPDYTSVDYDEVKARDAAIRRKMGYPPFEEDQ